MAFGVTADKLKAICDNGKENPDQRFEQLFDGGINSLAEKLRVNLEVGLDKEGNQHQRIAAFGQNVLPEPAQKKLWRFFWEALKDPVLILLTIFSISSMVTSIVLPPPGDSSSSSWIEGAAILVAVFIVVVVSGVNNYSKELKFRELNKTKNDTREVKVLRSGTNDRLLMSQVLVGDIVELESGDFIPADGIFIEGHGVRVDESSLTGESLPVKKSKESPFLLSGTEMSEGSCHMFVLAVGTNSEWGSLYKQLSSQQPVETPLQEQLRKLAKVIGSIGITIAAVLFIILLSRYIYREINDDVPFKLENLRILIHYALQAISIVVVAVPEGLPLAVTLSLAYSMKSMLQDKNLVRHLNACETTGGATNICSDKTGTLTENRMTITTIYFGGRTVESHDGHFQKSDFNDHLLQILALNSSINSTAFLRKNPKKHEMEFVGNKTECSLLMLLQKLGIDYKEIRKSHHVISVFPFSSERKRMSTLISSNNIHVNFNNSKSEINESAPYSIFGCWLTVFRMILLCKGASEIILELCSEYLDQSGSPQSLNSTEKSQILNTATEFSKKGLRTLALAYRPLELDHNQQTKIGDMLDICENHMVFIAIVGIEDPIRPEVPNAIQLCKNAGITVRMVTGDNVLTAKKIARDCGIIHQDSEAIEGPQFRKMSDSELDKILPQLKVLARSSPADKLRLVQRLKAHSEVVAVTGDGTNDAPALKAADVGIGMGIAGTEVAKEASDIIIMDDNFASIVKAVMWGRNVRDSIQKFLQFQLTINFAALPVAFLSACLGMGEPLKPIQLLWVNLIQDTLAALALATDKPTEEVLNRKPTGRTERLLTPTMWRNIICTGLYQLSVMLVILFLGPRIFGFEDGGRSESDVSVHYTFLFNTFVFMQLFNEINARVLGNDWNPFKNFWKNRIFLSILVITTVLQVLFVELGGEALDTKRLGIYLWLSSIGIGVSNLIVGSLIRVLIPVPAWRWLKYSSKDQYLRDEEQEERQSENDSLIVPINSTAN